MTPTRRPRRRQDSGQSTHERRPLTDFNGFMLIATGAVLLLCLISYRVQDLPDWISFSRGKPVGNSNIFGIIGTVLAGYSFFLLGGAAFFLPMGLVWFGVAKILMRLRLLWRPPWAWRS